MTAPATAHRHCRRVPPVLQVELADCGSACLAMVLAYWGRRVRLDDVRDATGTGRDGTDALGLVRAAASYGLDARGVKADLDDLAALPQGTILHWEFSHFVVLERVRRDTVEIVDPAVGRLRVPMERFRRCWTGVAVICEPTAGFVPSGRRPSGLRPYLRRVAAQATLVRRILVTSVLLRLFALAVPLVTGVLVDRVVPDGDRHLLLVVGCAMAAMVAYTFAGALLRAHLLLHLRTRLDREMSEGFMDHLVDQPYPFFLRRSAGDLMMRLRSTAVVRETLTAGALSSLLDGALVVLYLAVLFAVDTPLAGVVVALGAAQVAVLAAARRRNEALTGETLHTEARSQSYVYQMLAGIESLKAAGAERRAATHWSGLFVDELNVALRRGRLDALVDSALTALRVAAPLAVLVAGGLRVLSGDLTLGTMLAGTALAAGFLEPLESLVTTGLRVQQLGSYLERIGDVLDAPREGDDGERRPAGRLTGHIRADEVSFSYHANSPRVVDGVSLTIEPGQTVAIVGRSGSGKTTLAHLLLGLYEPTGGRILYDGCPLSGLEPRSVRSQIGIVTQNTYLFGTSIRDNIALTEPSLDRRAVVAAAQMACVAADIEAMPMGYDTVLSNGGSSLSGGQRQRVVLARALACRPSVLLLDEATSALDALTERAVFDNLAGLGCTTVVIAHRLSTIARADLIVVMEAGRVVEAGDHATLVAEGGRYAELVTAQRDPSPTPAGAGSPTR